MKVPVGKEQEEKLIIEDRTFFCSEHVAKAYKIIGVFDTEVSSTQFWPSTLAGNNLPLAENVSLSPVINIVPTSDFNEEIPT